MVRERTGGERHRPCEIRSQMGRDVPKRDSFSRLRCAMLDVDRSEEILDGEFVSLDDEPACVDLEPIQTLHRTHHAAAPRPDPSFLTQLIATADQAPQTRSLRRASPADAQMAYGASRNRPCGTGFRTRQTI